MASIVQKSSTQQSRDVFFLLNEVMRYEDVLKPLYEKELLEVYQQSVIAMARPTTGRVGYQEIVGVLRRMLNYEGGEECVCKLLEEWRSTYRNRPAMQDELSRVFADSKRRR